MQSFTRPSRAATKGHQRLSHQTLPCLGLLGLLNAPARSDTVCCSSTTTARTQPYTLTLTLTHNTGQLSHPAINSSSRAHNSSSSIEEASSNNSNTTTHSTSRTTPYTLHHIAALTSAHNTSPPPHIPPHTSNTTSAAHHSQTQQLRLTNSPFLEFNTPPHRLHSTHSLSLSCHCICNATPTPFLSRPRSTV